jgi:hypothetical protein
LRLFRNARELLLQKTSAFRKFFSPGIGLFSDLGSIWRAGGQLQTAVAEKAELGRFYLELAASILSSDGLRIASTSGKGIAATTLNLVDATILDELW